MPHTPLLSAHHESHVIPMHSAASPAYSAHTGTAQQKAKTSSDVHEKPQRMKSTLVSRNVTISGHRTSVRLEPEMWNGLAEICRRECASMHEVCSVVSGHKPIGSSLTAAIRVFVMAYFRAASTEDGHNRAGHGPGGHLMMSLMAAKDKK